MNSGQFPIPDRLNALLVTGTAGGIIASIVFLGETQMYDVSFYMVSILLGLLFLTNYSLLHEACHGKLNSRPWLNYFLGIISACLFPISLFIIQNIHNSHHLRNRTDDEMFDLYYDEDNVFIKRMRWYGLLTGAQYLIMVCTSLLFIVTPRSLIVRLMYKYSTYGSFIESALTPANMLRARLEAFLVFLLLILAFNNLNMLNVLPGFYLGIFLWSSNQYLPHAFSNRDLTEGAFNLTGAGLMSWIILNRENDLTHHREPGLPWLYLRHKRKPDDEKVNYYRQWLRQWMGPRLTSRKAQQ